MDRAAATASLEQSRPAELTRLWEALCGRASHLDEIARLFRHRPEHALWERVQLLSSDTAMGEGAAMGGAAMGGKATAEGAVAGVGAAAVEGGASTEGAAAPDAANATEAGGGGGRGGSGGGSGGGEQEEGGGEAAGRAREPSYSYAYFEGVSGVERAAQLVAHLGAAEALLRCCEIAVSSQQALRRVTSLQLSSSQRTGAGAMAAEDARCAAQMLPQRMAQESRLLLEYGQCLLLTMAMRTVLAADCLLWRTAQESRLLDLVVQMSDEAHDLVRQLQDWRRVAREQAAASEVALSSKASERQQLLKSVYRIEARLLATIESPVEIAGAPPHPWRAGGPTEHGSVDPGGAGQMARGAEHGAGCGAGCGTEQGILAAASTSISPSLRLGMEGTNGNGPLVHLATPVRSLSRSISGSLSGSLASVNSVRDREAMKGFEAAAAAAATAASGGEPSQITAYY